MENQTRSVDVTPRDIAEALNGISDWVRSVRSAVLKMESGGTATLEAPTLEMMAPPGQGNGCPPPRPVKRKTKKAGKSKKKH